MAVAPQFTNGSKMVFARSNAGGNAGVVPSEVRTFRGWQGAYAVFERPDGTWMQELLPASNIVAVGSTVPAVPSPLPRNTQQGNMGDNQT
jgi:hypothetical protein